MRFDFGLGYHYGQAPPECREHSRTADLRTKILDLRGFDPGRILFLMGGILMSVGNFPEGLSQHILVGIILVGRLGARDGVRESSDHVAGGAFLALLML